MISEKQWIETFSEELQFYMRDRNISQRELAKETGLSESTISDYIHARRMPGVKAIVNICDVLDLEIGELVDFGSRIE